MRELWSESGIDFRADVEQRVGRGLVVEGATGLGDVVDVVLLIILSDDKKIQRIMIMKEIEISESQDRLDREFVHEFLRRSYWGEGRTLEEVEVSIGNSHCFGVYKDGRQIGFARVVTDGVFFAYLMDVFIIEAEQGRGYAQELLTYIFDLPKFKKVKTWKLSTNDAHGLYEKFGFQLVEENHTSMVRRSIVG